MTNSEAIQTMTSVAGQLQALSTLPPTQSNRESRRRLSLFFRLIRIQREALMVLEHNICQEVEKEASNAA